eukprot:8306704-Heterocapsa_arctica.AAC.3
MTPAHEPHIIGHRASTRARLLRARASHHIKPIAGHRPFQTSGWPTPGRPCSTRAPRSARESSGPPGVRRQ